MQTGRINSDASVQTARRALRHFGGYEAMEAHARKARDGRFILTVPAGKGVQNPKR